MRTFGTPGTLRGRLALLAVLTTALWVGALTVAFHVVLDQRLAAEARDVLRTRAAAVAATVTVRPGGDLLLSDPRSDSALDADIWVYQARPGSAVALERPTDSAALQAAADALAGTQERFRSLAGALPAELYSLPVLDGRRQVGTVVAAVALGPYLRTARLGLYGSVGLAVLLLPGVYLLTRRVVGRAMRPVQDMSRQAARWSGDDVTRRFGSVDRPGELAALAASFDGLLDRLAAALRYETRLTAELSHELRTPLARVTAEIDLLRSRSRPAAELDAAHARIAASAEQMSELLETLLSAARSAGDRPPGRCSAGPVLEAAARRLLDPVLPEGGLQLTGLSEEVQVGVEAAVLERIVSPVLDNAGRYARSRVAVRLTLVDGKVQVSITDDGPGVPADLAEAVFEPGRRADPADGHDGAGLGLALGRRLARAAGGDLRWVAGAFVATLPAG